MERLRQTLNVAIRGICEAHVNALVIAMCQLSGKGFDNGYLVMSEFQVSPKTPADIAVDRVDGFHKVLVVESKRTMGQFAKGEKQLVWNMEMGRYPHGLLIRGRRATFYNLDLSEEDTVPVEGTTYSNRDELEQVVDEIRSF